MIIFQFRCMFFIRINKIIISSFYHYKNMTLFQIYHRKHDYFPIFHHDKNMIIFQYDATTHNYFPICIMMQKHDAFPTWWYKTWLFSNLFIMMKHGLFPTSLVKYTIYWYIVLKSLQFNLILLIRLDLNRAPREHKA